MQHGPGLHMGGAAKKLARFEVALKNAEQIAEGTYEFTFEKPEEFHFSAGQHIRMALIEPPETDAEGDQRFLTMASTPQEPDLVFAMRMRDTAFKRVLRNMLPGEKVIIQKLLGETPKGSFVLHDDPSKPAVFIVGGIGVVPAYAMIKDAIQRNLAHKLFLFYSNRRPEDAPYLVELQRLAGQNPSFTLIATMTEPEKSVQAWSGQTGVIDRALLKKHLPVLGSPIYYLAGLPEMVSSMEALLTDAGVTDDNIRAEEFTGFNLNDLQADKESKWKAYTLPVILGLAIVTLVLVHTGALGSLSHTKPYLVIALLLAIVAFKILLALKIKRKLHSGPDAAKLSADAVLKAHIPNKRRN